MAGTDKSEAGGRPRARDLNEQIRYTMWSVFRVCDRAALAAGAENRDGLAAELEEFADQAAGKDVITRGCYDVQGLRADADYMFWWTAPAADDLQEVYARFRRTGPGQRAGLVGDGAAPAGRVQQGPRPRLPRRGGTARLCVRVPVRPVLRVVPAGPGGAPGDARRARHDGPRVPRRPREHGRLLRPERL